MSVLGHSENCGCAGNLATQASVVFPAQRQAGFEMVYLEEVFSIKSHLLIRRDPLKVERGVYLTKCAGLNGNLTFKIL